MTTLRAVLVVHGVITLAGAAVLMLFPTAIPSVAGITLDRQAYLLVYLVGAAELAVAVLSFGAARLTDRAALRLIVVTLAVLHATSGVLDIVYMSLTQANTTMVVNAVVRFVVAAVFVGLWRTVGHQTYGTRR
ncbi:hypothetical protein A5698_03930 [Mycobacterium sp. E136]|uniref:hypothetical protein n=1 Tax=Mycobacterium sp. E136 TaxID=1834125 RepID=UPI0007FB77ED|nr:hypothetical protein [Mycobacterium sp. E136]OBG85549.1 hypothetical protein A5698_03930 [Mycobacterium sp. E136]